MDVREVMKARIEALYEQWLLDAADRLWKEWSGHEALAMVKEAQERRLKALKAVEEMFR